MTKETTIYFCATCVFRAVRSVADVNDVASDTTPGQTDAQRMAEGVCVRVCADSRQCVGKCNSE